MDWLWLPKHFIKICAKYESHTNDKNPTKDNKNGSLNVTASDFEFPFFDIYQRIICVK